MHPCWIELLISLKKLVYTEHTECCHKSSVVKHSLVKEDVDLHTSPEVNHRWEGGKENTKESYTHSWWLQVSFSSFSRDRFLCWLCLTSCDLSCLSESSLKDLSNKPVFSLSNSSGGPGNGRRVAYDIIASLFGKRYTRERTWDCVSKEEAVR